MEKKTFECGGRKATLFGSEQSDAPLIILNNYSGDGESVVSAMQEIDTPDSNLLVVGDLNWDHDMTPWYCPPLSKNDTPCTGGADEYLDLLLTATASMPSRSGTLRRTRTWSEYWRPKW